MEATKRRLGRRTVRVLAWGSGVVAFALPWATFRFLPSPVTAAQAPAQQVVVVPAGSKVVVTGSPNGTPGVQVITAAGTPTTGATTKHAPVTTTRASAPPVL
jgi:hypothetical protein